MKDANAPVHMGLDDGIIVFLVLVCWKRTQIKGLYNCN